MTYDYRSDSDNEPLSNGNRTHGNAHRHHDAEIIQAEHGRLVQHGKSEVLDGVIYVDQSVGLLDIEKPLSCHGTVVVQDGATLKLGAAVADGITVQLDLGMLEFAMPGPGRNPGMTFLGSVSDFGKGDTIKVDGVWAEVLSRNNLLTLTPVDQTHEALSLWLSGTQYAQIKLDGGYDITGFTLDRSGSDAVIHYDPALVVHPPLS